MKKALSLVLSLATLISIISVFAVPVSAASYSTNYSSYSAPSSSDYAYWNGSRTVKASGTTTSEIKWIQTSLNYLIKYKGLNASYLDVDGSFGPASRKAVLAFQKKYNLTQDGSCGPNTIAKIKQVLGNSGPVNQNTGSSKTLNINWTLIRNTGKQSESGPCLCYALAYCRDILDGTQHKWTEFSEGYLSSKGRYSHNAVSGKAGYSKKYASSTAAVYTAVYNELNKGKPVIINVKNGRSSGCHYVAVVGYVNVTSSTALSASNFLIIDSAGGGYNTENLGSLGYTLLKESGQYKYYID